MVECIAHWFSGRLQLMARSALHSGVSLKIMPYCSTFCFVFMVATSSMVTRCRYYQGSGLAIHRLQIWVLAWHHTSYLHLCTSVTEQYNLVPAMRGWSLWFMTKSPASWSTAKKPVSVLSSTLVIEYGTTLLMYVHSVKNGCCLMIQCRLAVTVNVVGVRHIVELCRKLDRIEVLDRGHHLMYLI